jgi:ribulose-5-phosphate 4-epimerase/fuculose-1-phosphate aldolase
MEGEVLEGEWPVPLGIPLHLQLHRLRSDVGWAVHNHPRFGTVWADLGEVPPILDQSSALGGGTLVLVDEYDGAVNDPDSARRAVERMGPATAALLAGHGVFVLGGSARAAHQRAVALEQRCRSEWMVRAAGGDGPTALPAGFLEFMAASDGEGFLGFWEAAVRTELRADPSLLD